MLDSAGKYGAVCGRLTRFLNERDAYLALVHRARTRLPRPEDPIADTRAPPTAAATGHTGTHHPAPAGSECVGRAKSNVTARRRGWWLSASRVLHRGADRGLRAGRTWCRGRCSEADFHSRSFLGFLRDLKLQPEEREILIYLSSETKLGLAGIAAATGHSIERTAAAITQLVDLSVVEVLDGEYSMTAPIQTTVLRTEDGLGRRWYERASRGSKQSIGAMNGLYRR